MQLQARHLFQSRLFNLDNIHRWPRTAYPFEREELQKITHHNGSQIERTNLILLPLQTPLKTDRQLPLQPLKPPILNTKLRRPLHRTPQIRNIQIITRNTLQQSLNRVRKINIHIWTPLLNSLRSLLCPSPKPNQKPDKEETETFRSVSRPGGLWVYGWSVLGNQ